MERKSKQNKAPFTLGKKNSLAEHIDVESPTKYTSMAYNTADWIQRQKDPFYDQRAIGLGGEVHEKSDLARGRGFGGSKHRGKGSGRVQKLEEFTVEPPKTSSSGGGGGFWGLFGW